MNLREFAAHLGTSPATVSRAFSNRGRISAATRERILQEAELTGYRPNIAARSMARGRSDAIGLFYAAPKQADSDYYVAELSFGIASAAARAGRRLQIHAVNEGDPEALRGIDEPVGTGAVDGFIVNLYSAWAERLIETANKRQLPYVIIDNTRAPSANILSLADGIEAAFREAGAYLRGQEKRSIGFIHGIHDARKLAGLKAGLGPALANSLERDTGGMSFADGHAACRRLLDKAPDLDALCCANDVLGTGALRAACEMGRRVPDDLAIIGCDDLRLAQFTVPALTTIRLPKFDMGELAVEKLLALIAGEPPAPQPRLACRLILRESA